MNFFSFSVSGNEVAESDTSSVSLECLQYLEDKSTSVDRLHKFPTIRKMFSMYNSAIPSSAPVERLFPIAQIPLDSTRLDTFDVSSPCILDVSS